MGSANWRQAAAAVVFAIVLVGEPSRAFADDAAAGRQYTYEIRVYQALTNITGAGLISQTLPGMNGWLQVIHQKLDDVELVMDGTTLAWNGQPTPDNPRIMGVSSPTITTLEGEQADVAIGSTGPLQYMERQQDGLFELKETQSNDVGIFLKVKPTRLVDREILASDLSFQYFWVRERKRIEGVHLEVGQPILGHVATEGAIQMRLGEWSCYQTPVESEGCIYVFVRATQEGPEAVASKRGVKGETVPVGEKPSAKTEKSGGGPKVEVGGSVELRGEYWSGRHK